MFTSRFLPCPDCGESVERFAAPAHRCSRERLADFQVFRLRHDIAMFDARWRGYLRSSTGRFEVWLAARQVRGTVR